MRETDLVKPTDVQAKLMISSLNFLSTLTSYTKKKWSPNQAQMISSPFCLVKMSAGRQVW